MRAAKFALLGFSFLLVASCGKAPAREARSSVGLASRTSADREAERVRILDDCDPATFNAAVGPGTCVGKGETTFQEFVGQLQAEKVAEDWVFEDDRFDVAPGAKITAVNRGGETHSFTQVKEFGGGFVPFLNQLSGNPKTVPECQFPGVAPSLVPTGGSRSVSAPAGGTVKFQCCIHPWMRAVGTVKADD